MKKNIFVILLIMTITVRAFVQNPFGFLWNEIVIGFCFHN